MYPFWEMVIAPVIAAADAHRVLEIGALRGETTSLMFDQLGATSELHVIDPLPQFDPEVHEANFGGRYHFHRALSLDVLEAMPAFDVALIDGDHNWYTVFHELTQLSATARRDGAELPLLVLHDVTWPYGHRDLYYDPTNIPEEHRHPHRQGGMAPGYLRVLPEGGLNADLNNAIDGGGGRNGVMCALEDFIAQHDEPLRTVLFPFYFGLAIVVSEARLDASPALRELLDRFESAPGRERQLHLAERIRLDAAVHEHNWNRVQAERLDGHRRRYLELLKDSLLNVHYLEDEVRLEYLLSLPPGTPADPDSLRDPARTLEVRFKKLAQAREAGRSTDEPRGIAYHPYSDMGRVALDQLELALVDVAERHVDGDVVLCGVGRGGAGIAIRAGMEAYEIDDRSIWLIDTFLATDGGQNPEEPPGRARLRADLNQVRDGFERFGLFDDRLRFLQGGYVDSLSDADLGPIALLRIGLDAAFHVGAVLAKTLPRLSPGGIVIVEGVGRPVIAKRLQAFAETSGLGGTITHVDWNTVAWQVKEPTGGTEDAPVPLKPERARHRVPLPGPHLTKTTSLDLSVVVVFYNMAREAPRTLQSLSRAYQRNIDGVHYEVLVIDNGSDPDERLTQDAVEAYGPEFRLITLEDASPSPTVALNLGIEQATGRSVALMIDGAHVVTPGVFHHALKAMETYEPAVVAIQQWYVGPGQQGDAQQAGYDQEAEDRLFRGIRWPTDGYRLFEIGHFIGDRDWFDGIIESNCLFVPRSVLEQVGSFDDSFDMAGGGYANLELYERLHAHPHVTAASVLGEGSFHQFHGGTTTNVADEAIRRERISSYGKHFTETRGRGLRGLNKAIHYVGAMDTKAARRTRSRREFLLGFDPERDPVESTDAPPLPIPEELKFAAIEALWGQQAWREATWMGQPVSRYPTDLHSYQELIHQVRPDAVIWVGDDEGVWGRAAYSASLLDHFDAGQVIVVTNAPPPNQAKHRRITVVSADADAPQVVQKLVGEGEALAFVGLGAADRVEAAFEAYAPLVPVHSYVIIENTVLNGRPVVSSFGPGPHEAVNSILRRHHDFVPDVAYERYTVTFNKNGYLRRMPAE